MNKQYIENQEDRDSSYEYEIYFIENGEMLVYECENEMILMKKEW